MHWLTYLESQPPATALRLLTDLTLGYGTLALMARQLAADGELGEIVTTFARAEVALDRAWRRVAGSPRRRRLPEPVAAPVGVRWQAYLRARPAGDGPAVLGRLQELVRHARESGETLLADGTVDGIVAQLTMTLDVLERARHDLEVVAWSLADPPTTEEPDEAMPRADDGA